MKKIILFTFLSVIASSVVHAEEPRTTLEQAYADDKAYSDIVDAATRRASPEQLDHDWRTYVSLSKIGGKIETVKITGSECAQKYCYAYAQCPSNYKLTGGGWELTQYSGGTGFSAPNASYPDVVNNRWVLYRGGMDEWRGYRAYAVCLKI